MLDSLSPAAERFIVANTPVKFDVPVYPDIHPGSALGGLHAALTHASHDWLALAACDMPFLSADYWLALAAHHERVEAVVVSREGRLEPLAALYHKRLLPRIEMQLATKQYKLRGLLEPSYTRTVAFETLHLPERTLLNANRLSDLPLEGP